MDKKKQIGVSLDVKMLEELKKVAKEDGLGVASFVRQLIAKSLKARSEKRD